MPAEVIDRVHVLAHRTVGAGAAGLAFTDRIGNPFIDPANDDSSNNETYTPDTSDMDDNYDSDDDDTDSEQADNNDDHPTDISIAPGVYDEEHEENLTGYKIYNKAEV